MSSLGRGKRFTLLISVLAAGACTSDRTPSATVEPHGGRLQAYVGSVTSCDVTELQKDAKDYFGSGSNPASSDIRDLADACKNSLQGAANAAGFRVFEDIAAKAASTSPGPAQAGGELTVGVLAFMDIGSDALADFVSALGPNGMYRVRPAGVASATGSRGGYPDWRISATWAFQTLVYGYPTTASSNGTQVDVARGRYDINSLPDNQITTTRQALIAYCTGSPTTFLTDNWVQHQPVGLYHTFLIEQETAVSALCAQTNVASAPARATMLLAAAERALAFFSPADLLAQEKTKVGGVGGFGSDLSPFFVANLGATVTSFVEQPRNDSASTELNDVTNDVIRVRVLSENGGVPIPNALVTLMVYNNSGDNAGAYLTIPGDECAGNESVCIRTGQDGIARFNGLLVNKAGGYILSASAIFDGMGGNTALTVLFQVQNK